MTRRAMTDAEIEEQLQNAGKAAPRVTPEHIQSVIGCEYFTTLDKAFPDCPVHPSMGLVVLCVLVLRNGFVVTGEAACVSPENFVREIGEKIAKGKAVDKIWMLEGYALQERLHLSAYPERHT